MLLETFKFVMWTNLFFLTEVGMTPISTNIEKGKQSSIAKFSRLFCHFSADVVSRAVVSEI